VHREVDPKQQGIAPVGRPDVALGVVCAGVDTSRDDYASQDEDDGVGYKLQFLPAGQSCSQNQAIDVSTFKQSTMLGPLDFEVQWTYPLVSRTCLDLGHGCGPALAGR